MSPGVALVTGIAGQDGSWLAEILLRKGYEVHGLVRRHSVPHFPNIQHLIDTDTISLHEADLADQSSLESVIHRVKPDAVYNLAAQSHVGTSFHQPELTQNVTAMGAYRVLEAVRRGAKRAHVYQASSSEMLGNAIRELGLTAGDETTPFRPVSPYGNAKVTAHHYAQMFRKTHGMHVSCGILFNHESERRGHNFVTRKITLALARIAVGSQQNLRLGNLDAVRDWGYAPEYMEAAIAMLQQDQPGDYVVATGDGRTVQDFLQHATASVERLVPEAPPLLERVTSVPEERRPHDIDYLVGNPSKAEAELGWRPRTDFKALVRLMCENDVRQAQAEVARHA